ncbi:hypothetical protein CDAR_523101 [Caerostris darwini]|uniref:Uncharacterized protein n=1 Tax=Caerostris darwini TaxID=1538125 RepID=A0AAV4TC59_9ARAC|nr:hypothetical protein CDAR_523101 [Caerostris darwini]
MAFTGTGIQYSELQNHSSMPCRGTQNHGPIARHTSWSSSKNNKTPLSRPNHHYSLLKLTTAQAGPAAAAVHDYP